jgi:hypothetical protein
MRWWVCHLQLLLPSPAQSFSGLSTMGPHFVVSDMRLPQLGRARSPYLYPPGTRWPSCTPRYWVPFWPPPTTSRAVWDPCYISSGWTHTKHRSFSYPQECVCVAQQWVVYQESLHGYVLTESLPSSGRLLWLHYSGSI